MMAAKTRRWKPNKDIQGQDLRRKVILPNLLMLIVPEFSIVP